MDMLEINILFVYLQLDTEVFSYGFCVNKGKKHFEILGFIVHVLWAVIHTPCKTHFGAQKLFQMIQLVSYSL